MALHKEMHFFPFLPQAFSVTYKWVFKEQGMSHSHVHPQTEVQGMEYYGIHMEWMSVPSGRKFPLCRAAVLHFTSWGVDKRLELPICCPRILGAAAYVTSFLGVPLDIPYWGSILICRSCPALLTPHAIGIFEQYDKVTWWPFYDS